MCLFLFCSALVGLLSGHGCEKKSLFSLPVRRISLKLLKKMVTKSTLPYRTGAENCLGVILLLKER